MSELPEFEVGETLTIRGNTYEVEDVDRLPFEDKIIQYDINAEDGPTARLEPTEDAFVLVEYYEQEVDEIQREEEK